EAERVAAAHGTGALRYETSANTTIIDVIVRKGRALRRRVELNVIAAAGGAVDTQMLDGERRRIDHFEVGADGGGVSRVVRLTLPGVILSGAAGRVGVGVRLGGGDHDGAAQGGMHRHRFDAGRNGDVVDEHAAGVAAAVVHGHEFAGENVLRAYRHRK